MFSIMVTSTSKQTVWNGQILSCVVCRGAGREDVPRQIRGLQIVLKSKGEFSAHVASHLITNQTLVIAFR